ncbi:MAG: DoxX family protein [Myxococcales bacterium]|jgi:hypothetical protein|nr:DoxX family protein [Myxococcales bacterium]
MSKKNIAYIATTAPLALLFAFGGAVDLSGAPEVIEGFAQLGYPAYFPAIIGLWKVLGAAVIALPRLPLLKEWAYAGLAFDLTGASASHAFAGDPIEKVIIPLVMLGVVAASWALRPESRKLPGLVAAPREPRAMSEATA